MGRVWKADLELASSDIGNPCDVQLITMETVCRNKVSPDKYHTTISQAHV